MASDEPRDSRRCERLPVSFPVLYSGEDGTGQGQAADLSMLGCAVRSDAAVEPKTYLKLQLSMPDGDASLDIELAVVRWSHGGIFGVEFIAFGEVQKKPGSNDSYAQSPGRVFRHDRSGKRRRIGGTKDRLSLDCLCRFVGPSGATRGLVPFVACGTGVAAVRASGAGGGGDRGARWKKSGCAGGVVYIRAGFDKKLCHYRREPDVFPPSDSSAQPATLEAGDGCHIDRSLPSELQKTYRGTVECLWSMRIAEQEQAMQDTFSAVCEVGASRVARTLFLAVSSTRRQ